MPVGFSSAARNLFLLGSSGADVVTNFFRTIDRSSGTDDVYLPDEIIHANIVTDDEFKLAGTAQDPNSKEFGWIESRGPTGFRYVDTRVESNLATVDTTLRALHLDNSYAVPRVIAAGKTGGVPWMASYSAYGQHYWSSTSNSAGVEYTGITSIDGNYYACGNTDPSGSAQAFIEKFDTDGNPGWGKSAFMLGRDVVLNKISANSRDEVISVGHLEDDDAFKGYVVKLDAASGEVLWDRTIETFETGTIGQLPILCEDVFVDSRDMIYVVGRIFDLPITRSFIIKYSPEGNILWQRETEFGEQLEYYQVKADGPTGQVIVFGRYFDSNSNDIGGVLSKYTRDGSLVWRRTLYSSYNNSDTFGQTGGRTIGLDADPSFYHLLFIDDSVSISNGTPIAYTYGKVSSSGNGLGSFEYDDGEGETIFYDILNVGDRIGRLSDGSVRNDISDLATNTLTPTKIMFDDYATPITNKKRQMDSANSFEYSGSPALRPADFQELNLLGDAGVSREPDGVIHSFNVTSTGGYAANSGPDKAFDGNIDTFCQVQTSGKSVAWTPSVSINTADEIFVYGFAAADRLQVYGSLGSATNLIPGTVDGVTQVYTVPTNLGIVESMRVVSPSGTAGFSAVKVGGEILVDARGKWEDQSGKGNGGEILVTDILKEPHPGFGSVKFDGFDDYLSMPDSQLLELLDSDFTIEFWIYPTGIPQGTFGCIFSKGLSVQCYFMNTNSISLYLDDDNSAVSGYNVFSNANLTGTDSVPLNQWSHVAICRDGNGWKAFVNGDEKYTNSIPGLNPVFNTSDDFEIGDYGPSRGTYPFQGFISNFRFLKGTALYAANFTVPTTPLTSTGSDTSLLTCQGTGTIVDARPGTPNVITANGGVATTSLKTAPTYNDAGYWVFDGANDYIETGVTSEELLGGEFAVELWFNVNDIPNSVNRLIEASRSNYVNDLSSINWALFVSGAGGGGGQGILNKYGTGGDQTNNYGFVYDGSWHHVVMNHRVGTDAGQNSISSFDIYLDGVNVSSNELDDYDASNSYGFIRVGTDFDGNIGEVRIYRRELTPEQVFQNYNSTKTSYLYEAPETSPNLSSTGGFSYTQASALPVETDGLLVNYDFKDEKAYNPKQNILQFNTQGQAFVDDFSKIGGTTITSTTHMSPIGTRDAVSFTGTGFFCAESGMVDGKTYLFSAYVKSIHPYQSNGNVNTISIGDDRSEYGFNGTFSAIARFNLDDFSYDGGTSGQIGRDAIPIGGGWYRIWCKATKGNSDSSGMILYHGQDPAGPTETIVWGVQIEEYETSLNAVMGPTQYVQSKGTPILRQNTIKNLVNNAYKATISGAEYGLDSSFYRYFTFDNANNDEIITTQTTPADTGMPGLTVEVWARLDSNTVYGSGGQAWIIGEEGRWRMTYNDDGSNGVFNVACATANNGWFTSGTSLFAYPNVYMFDSWHHFVATYTDRLTLYYDGFARNANGTVISGNVLTSGDPVLSIMGTDAANVGWGSGDIGEVRIYNRGLSASEVQQNWLATRDKY